VHWYNDKGELCEVDLKEGRAKGYKPSTTEIIHEFENNYGLNMYFQKQTFLAAMTLPRPEGITDEQFYDLVVEDSKVHAEKARDFGVKVHDIVTKSLKKQEIASWYYFSDPAIKAAMKVCNWIEANEKNCIVDIKTTETKDGKFRQPYDSWLFQLCGYNCAKYLLDYNSEYVDHSFSTALWGGTIDYCKTGGTNNLKLINLIISSNEDIPIKVYPWKEAKVEWGTRTFLKMVELYHIYKKLG
jgi:hypothetical protein